MTALGESKEGVHLFTYQNNNAAFQTLADATVAATEAIIADHEMARDSFKWINQSWQEVQQDKDGLHGMKHVK